MRILRTMLAAAAIAAIERGEDEETLEPVPLDKLPAGSLEAAAKAVPGVKFDRARKAEGVNPGTSADLTALARRIDTTKSWLEIANEVKMRHPDGVKMIEAHQEIVDRARAHSLAKDLMTIR